MADESKADTTDVMAKNLEDDPASLGIYFEREEVFDRYYTNIVNHIVV